MQRCNKCNQLIFSDTYKCTCELFTIIDEDGDEYEIYALDDESAGLQYAEKSNVTRDYYLMEGSVKIKINGKLFIISAEPDVHYSATEI